MKLIDALLKAPVTDIAGARTASRFEYQQHWALSEILERHSKGQDYIFIFEFHDDVVVLDSEANPALAEFYQIKTKRGGVWKLRDLLERANEAGGGRKPSILGKLFNHRINFPDFSILLGFVTNADFDFVVNKEKLTHPAKTLEEEKKEQISNAIGDELPKLKPVDISILIFIRSPLSLDDYRRHVKGQLVEFLKDSMGTATAVSIDSWYRTLISEIEIKNNYSPTAIDDANALMKLKCFSRRQLQGYVEEIKRSEAKKRDWGIIEASLMREGFETSRVMMIRRSWDEVSANYMDSTNLLLAELYKNIESSLLKIKFKSMSLANVIDSIYDEIKHKYDTVFGGTYSKHYLEATILWVYCEKAD